MKNNMEAPQKTKNITIKQSSNSILGIYQKKTETLIPKDTHSSIVYCQDTEAT